MTGDFDSDRYVESAAPAVGIALSAAERAPVAEQMRRIHAFAELVAGLELSAHDESASSFEP